MERWSGNAALALDQICASKVSVVWMEQANELMQREMLEEQLEAQAAKTAEVRGRLDATLSELCAVATPSDLRMMRILKVRLPIRSSSLGLSIRILLRQPVTCTKAS